MRNKSETKQKPKPGSRAAQAAGCTCPVMDNHHGAGRGGDGKRHGWYFREDCRLHGDEVAETVISKPKAERKNPGFAAPRVPPTPRWVQAGPPGILVEDFLLSDFMESSQRRYSKILAGFHVRPDRKFRCPRCNLLMGSPPSHRYTHHGCGVSFRVSGNSLEVWTTVK